MSDRQRYYLDEHLEGYRPKEYWHNEPATQAQVAVLERRGYVVPAQISKGQASFVIDKPTPKMKLVLERHGLWWPGMTFAEARVELDALRRREGSPEAARHAELNRDMDTFLRQPYT
jgi:hypothetical protein